MPSNRTTVNIEEENHLLIQHLRSQLLGLDLEVTYGEAINLLCKAGAAHFLHSIPGDEKNINHHVFKAKYLDEVKNELDRLQLPGKNGHRGQRRNSISRLIPSRQRELGRHSSPLGTESSISREDP